MAERRMFAKNIIDSDAFLDMPLSAQALYFHMAMRADDEGFVNNPKKIMRMVNADNDSLKLLEAKRFIIPFESGIVVIRHWRIHNYIQSDRKKETVYTDERNLLTLDKSGTYNLDTGCIQDVSNLDTECIQDVSNLDTQDSIGKDSIGEDSIGEDRSLADAPLRCPYTRIKDLYHEICKSYPKIKAIEGTRKDAVKARWTAYPDVETFRELFTKAEASSFMKGHNDRNWRADFDFLMKPSKFSCILEGKYDDRQSQDNSQNEDNPYNFLWE